ncbi:MAG: helix-turn-helix transcriptional regulator [Microscillaceae bacterium]|jgi:transcriptional regulator with XRE-family HTH domain|nr:helix-turn-helix transcriptional regulator [Microscillaceae bacterium]
MELGQRIKKLRELRNFSQKYMAEKLEITQQTYSKMETGEIDFPVSRVKNIADILQIKPEDIFMFDEKAILSNNNCTFLGENVTAIGISQNLLQELQKRYEAQILQQQKEIDRLHSLLEKTLTK